MKTCQNLSLFQSTPNQKGQENPEGINLSYRADYSFNPLPTRKVRRTAFMIPLCHYVTRCFNPLPTRKVRRTFCTGSGCLSLRVSIHSQPERSGEPPINGKSRGHEIVSIHSQPERSGEQLDADGDLGFEGFQSTPNQKGQENALSSMMSSRIACSFQSTPNQKGQENIAAIHVYYVV